MNKYIIILFGALILLIGLSVWYSFSKTTKTTSVDDPNRPTVQVSKTTFDLGKMSVKETRSHDFTITNKGKTDLIVKQFTTSCGCTYANVVKDGKKSPKFSLHINSNWQTNIEPGKSVTLAVVYDPSAMPVQGRVERFVTFATNDPAKPSVELKLIAEVKK